MGGAHAAAGIKSTHGSGFCNLNIFLAHSRQYSKAAGVELEFVNTPTSAEMVTFLGMGQVDIGLMPYTSFMALYDAGAPVKIVAGGGVEGCAIVARPGLDTPEKLKGKTLGTFQLDTLEVMPYDYLKKHKISFKDVKVRYMGNTPEAIEAFKAGALDWICTIEPYASALVNDVKGAVMLTDGIDMYGKGYTDCVLAARASLIKDNPAGLKAIIKGMMQAQYDAETQTDAVLKELVGKYYKTSMENAKIAQGKQPAIVDARSQTSSSSTAPTGWWRWATSRRSRAATPSTGRCWRRSSRRIPTSTASSSTSRRPEMAVVAPPDFSEGRPPPGHPARRR